MLRSTATRSRGLATIRTQLAKVRAAEPSSSSSAVLADSGMAVKQGAQTEIGGNDRYLALCRKHFSAALAG